MRCTRYFLETRTRPDRQGILDEWIEGVLRAPSTRREQADGRIRCWGMIDAAGGRYLRVVVLADGVTVHNAFFDRDFKP